MVPWRKPIIETQWTDSLEIYQKWWSAMNEQGKASPLPIHHQWCVADKLPGSNKLLLRGWPHCCKQKLPHGHRSIQSSLLFNTTVSACLSTSGVISTILLLGGNVYVCMWADRKEQTHNLSPDIGWGSLPLLNMSAGRWSQKAVLTSCRWCVSLLLCSNSTWWYSMQTAINKRQLSPHIWIWCK